MDQRGHRVAQGFEQYLEIGQRIKTVRHAFNLREGITFEDKRMPLRARGVPPLEAGPNKGVTPDFDTLARDFHRAMGWDPNTTVPTDATLDRLGLDQVKEALRE